MDKPADRILERKGTHHGFNVALRWYCISDSLIHYRFFCFSFSVPLRLWTLAVQGLIGSWRLTAHALQRQAKQVSFTYSHELHNLMALLSSFY